MSNGVIRIGAPAVFVCLYTEGRTPSLDKCDFIRLGPTSGGVTVSTVCSKSEPDRIKITFLMLGKQHMQVGELYNVKLVMPPDLMGNEEVKDYVLRLVRTVHIVTWNAPESLELEFIEEIEEENERTDS